MRIIVIYNNIITWDRKTDNCGIVTIRIELAILGRVAEWLNAAVLKTAGLRRAREFESHLFRQETLKESKLSNEAWIFLLVFDEIKVLICGLKATLKKLFTSSC